MLLSGAMLLDYLGYSQQAQRLRAAIAQAYQEGETLPVDQGGHASTEEFVDAVQRHCATVRV